MIYSLLISALGATAAPVTRLNYFGVRQAGAVTDTQVVQFAATLENLEAAFYEQALAKWDAAAFTSAGFPPWFHGRVAQIASHEKYHASDLATALGNNSVAPCTYNFPFTTVKAFASLAAVVENVGVAAYGGAAGFITSKDILGVAASILPVEARHQAWLQAEQQGPPWTGPYDTKITPNMAFSIAAAFIASCPDSNPKLPFTAYPALNFTAPETGGQGTFSFNATGSATYKAFYYNGLGVAGETLTASGSGFTATIPSALQGYTYIVVSTADTADKVADDNIAAGPAIYFKTFDSYAENPPFRTPM